MFKILKPFLVVLILATVFLAGLAIGFRIEPEEVKYNLVSFKAKPGSLWDIDPDGFGGPLYQPDHLRVVVLDSSGKKSLEAQEFEIRLKRVLKDRGAKIVNIPYPRTLFVEISNFSVKRFLGRYSIEKTAHEIAREIVF